MKAFLLLWVLYQCWLKVDWIAVQYLINCLPEVNREFLLNTAKTTTRVFCFLYIIWQVLCYYRARIQYKMLSATVAYFMAHYKIQRHIQDRVIQYYEEAWLRNKIKFPIPVSKVLQMLPSELFDELIENLGTTVLEKLQLSQECFKFFVSIGPKAEKHYYSCGDLIIRKGTGADEMYFIADGILEATSDAGHYLDTMSSGDIVGEIGVLHIKGNYLRTANVRSVGDSEVFALKKKDVNEIINEFPEAKKILMSLGLKRLQRSKNLPKPRREEPE